MSRPTAAPSEPVPPPTDLSVRAARSARRLSDDLDDSDDVGELRPSADVDDGPASRRWWDQSLSRGAAGVVVLHSTPAPDDLDRRTPSTAHPVERWLRAAVREDINATDGAGLWFGAPAVAYALRSAAPGHHAMSRLDTVVDRLVRRRLEQARDRMQRAERPPRSEFDLVRGLTGFGAYLLGRDPHAPLLREVLSYLVDLTQPIHGVDDDAADAVPGWWTLDQPGQPDRRRWASGHADLGMAHGLTGPLALLALCSLAHVQIAGQTAAIQRINAWMTDWQQHSPTGPWWPQRVTLDEIRRHHVGRPGRTRTATSEERGPSRPSWCYGTPGIARAHQLAALALDDPDRQVAAESALLACLSDPRQLRQLRDPAVCHGWAGVLVTAWHVTRDATPVTRSALRAQLDHLLPAVIAAADNHLAPHPSGLIDGPAGIALALRNAATPPEERTPCWTSTRMPWARCLLLC